MKKEVIEIFTKELSTHKHRDILISYATILIDFYESNRKEAMNKFQKLLNKYNFESIPNFSEHPYYPHVTLFHGSGGLEFWPVIDYEGGVTGTDEEIGTIIQEPNEYPKEVSFDSPIFDEIRGWSYKLQHNIVFLWLCSIWQEIEGYNYGIVVKTLENNSVRQFIFNDLAWQDLSNYGFFNSKDIRIGRFFNRNLTLYEIYQRVNFNTYPINPYVNKWRKFRSKASEIEIAGWGNEVAERIDSKELVIIKKKDLKERLIWEKQKSNELLNREYYEVYYNDHKEMIHENAIEFKFHSGIHWYDNELKNRLDEKEINELERKLNIKLPFHFKQYIKLFNGRKFNKYYITFKINDSESIKIDEFYNIDELLMFNSELDKGSLFKNIFKLKNKKSIKWLKIAKTDSAELMIGVIPHRNFGDLQLEEVNGTIKKLDIDFKEFIKNAEN